MTIETCWTLRSGLLGVLDALRLMAFFVGHLLSGIGWLLFGCIFFMGSMAGFRLPDGEIFHFVGFLIVPGWLLLRFAAGLWPFGRRLLR